MFVIHGHTVSESPPTYALCQCPCCERWCEVSLQDLVSSFHLFFIPGVPNVIGQQLCCGFCEHVAFTGPEIAMRSSAKWKPTKPLSELALETKITTAEAWNEPVTEKQILKLFENLRNRWRRAFRLRISVIWGIFYSVIGGIAGYMLTVMTGEKTPDNLSLAVPGTCFGFLLGLFAGQIVSFLISNHWYVRKKIIDIGKRYRPNGDYSSLRTSPYSNYLIVLENATSR